MRELRPPDQAQLGPAVDKNQERAGGGPRLQPRRVVPRRGQAVRGKNGFVHR